MWRTTFKHVRCTLLEIRCIFEYVSVCVVFILWSNKYVLSIKYCRSKVKHSDSRQFCISGWGALYTHTRTQVSASLFMHQLSHIVINSVIMHLKNPRSYLIRVNKQHVLYAYFLYRLDCTFFCIISQYWSISVISAGGTCLFIQYLIWEK